MEYNLGRIGIVVHESYENGEEYEALDLVPYGGCSYIAKGPTQGNLPTDANYWVKLVEAGGSITVNGKSAVNGNIALAPSDIGISYAATLPQSGTLGQICLVPTA